MEDGGMLLKSAANINNARCTAKSVDLHDVLAYFDEQAKLELELENAKQRITPNTQGIVSKWDDVNETPTNEEDDSVLEVEGEFFDSTGIRVDRSQIEAQSVIIHKETPISVVRITKERPDFIQTTDSLTNFCKITSVFSLSDSTENTDKDNDVNVDIVNEANAANVTESAYEGLVDIKEEPLDVEINGELINFKYTLTDEETLDASETGSYDSMRCDSNLQGIIDNLPEINDTNQYVDVPEFVQINNFGLKELEELRRQQKLQQDDKTEENKKVTC
ncbi:hypothetical protein NQ314_002043 [Rhamnusium bicolor]|uniref:Uncharacterized protein n=1 Tax=Rhamnusium bicolor TaxID=1586634 RepID=A0AAV8ZQD8_9CUCU|nr:hypothetical protein NQ314_002043 [Rhamnusium bicolor]